MKTFFKNCILSKNLDVLFLLVFGILLQMTDGSPFTIKEKWMIVWETELPMEYFSLYIQKIIKTVLSIIVVIRCVTTYAYVVSAMLVIFCLLKDSAPKLMLLWLLIAGIKSILLTFVEALTGVYVCSAFGKIRKACIEFVVSKAVEIIFAAYLWGSVLNIYQDMEMKSSIDTKAETWEYLFVQKREFGRQRARSLLDETTLYKTACLNNFEFKDVPQIILQMLRRRTEMSSDSLLAPGMMLASVSNIGSFESLKASQSLGELGFVDLRSAQVFGLEDDETLTPPDKALKFLGLTWDDVKEAQKNKTFIGNDIYVIEKDAWNRLVDGRPKISRPRGRGEVFIQEIHQAEPEEKPRKRSFDFKFSWSFFNLYTPKEVSLHETDEEQDEEEDKFSREEEEYEGREDGEPPLFMSNIKEEVTVNRIRLNFVCKKWKGNSYAELYKQDYMSVIGPEVFEKATKLRKLTSLKSINNYQETVTSMSLPAFEKPKEDKEKRNLSDDSEEKISYESSIELNLKEYEPTVPLDEETEVTREKDTLSIDEKIITSIEKIDEVDTITEDKNLTTKFLLQKLNKLESESEENFEKLRPKLSIENNPFKSKLEPEKEKPISSIMFDSEFTDCTEKLQLQPCCKKRRIIIKRIGKKTTGIISTKYLLKKPGSHFRTKTFLDKEKFKIKKKLEKIFSKLKTSSFKVKTFSVPQKDQRHFLTELFQKPFLDPLETYYNLKKKIHEQKKKKMKFLEEEVDFNDLLKRKKQKISKTEVVKIFEAYHRKCSQNQNMSKMEEKMFVSFCATKEDDWKYSRNKIPENLTDFSKGEKKKLSESLNNFQKNLKEEQKTRSSSLGNLAEWRHSSQINLEENFLQFSSSEILKSISDLETGSENILRENFDSVSSGVSEAATEEEPISLYYSKAANLASPLLDMKRFIYPDHIHYSYKHVKKKGFDVDISEGFPLLLRESWTLSTPKFDSSSTHSELAITIRPMDLSFATSNAFAEWHNTGQSDSGLSEIQKSKSRSKTESIKEQKTIKSKKIKCSKKNVRENGSNFSPKKDFIKVKNSKSGNLNYFKHSYSSKDYFLIEKLVKMHRRLNNKEYIELENCGKERIPIQVSSTQLHSNRGRINSTYNPAIFLQENKNRNEKKKIETQEERTKDMFARLGREVLLQSKNQKSVAYSSEFNIT